MIGDELRRKLVELIKGNTPKQTSICEVISVDENKLTCTVKELETDAELFQVRLNADKTALQTVLIPKVGSMVLVGIISNDTRARYVAMVSQVDKIYLNGGENGGLIKVEQLVTKLNQLVSEVNALKTDYTAHIHPTPSGASSAPTVPFAGTFSQFDKSNFENEKVKH